ncbi:vacuolar sorting-associated 35B-like [Micractinium conductrix]|uniref:Vacuolar sorting-associated 35B-like n=1 Tax=Micractinium conductrix TaxID=554055 RepID=A0A2P6VHR1_9CHLO|nr:vacuolar sorting-associated 35B-like [Micractinium conductrix]|eukprot:PSC73631.1 vacuolar sorting-associated 35B-like [Micractinium conductrix]
MEQLPEDQRAWLKDAQQAVKRHGFYLRKAIDDDNMKEALRYSAALLGELRTSLLSPQKYYELYMQACDELRNLEMFFRDEASKGRSHADLYDLVQHAGNIVPRLYLLCTAGACYIRGSEAPAKLILRDVAEMCKGVQHPTRGLFLRAYLVQCMRGLLPDTGSQFESEDGGNVVDALEFLLVNFTEMNRLWVRMQHQGSARDREKRERERQQLADLVGKNLTYLSQLDGLTFQLYRDVVLPRVLEQIVGCRDDIAQQYLMQCTIMVFPDEFHLGTLQQLLGALPALQPGVRVHSVLSLLMDRLANYAASEKSVVQEMSQVDAFGQMSSVALKVVEQHPEMPAADVAAMYSALLGFSGTVYPDKLEYVDLVLQTCYNALQRRGPISEPKAERQVVALLSAPLEKYDVVTVLGLSHYPSVMELLQPRMKREMAIKIVQTLLKSGTQVSGVDKVEMLFSFVAPLVRGMEGLEDLLDEEDVAEDSGLLARLVHNLRARDGDTDAQHAMLAAAQRHFLSGGPQRMRHTLPPLAFCALETVRRVAAAEQAGAAPQVGTAQWYAFLHQTVSELAGVPAAELALPLFLLCALSASEEAALEATAYEFFEQAFVLYEEAIPDSRQEVRALHSIMGTLNRCYIFSGEERAALAHKASSYCSKLLKRTDQCSAVLAAAHLHWQPAPPAAAAEGAAAAAAEERPPARDEQGVMACLKRALKLANAAQQQLAVAAKPRPRAASRAAAGGEAGGAVAGPPMLAPSPSSLFVEILNHYLYFFDHGCTLITPAVLQSLLELVANEMSAEACKEDQPLQAFYANTLQHIRQQKAKGGEAGARYEALMQAAALVQAAQLQRGASCRRQAAVQRPAARLIAAIPAALSRPAALAPRRRCRPACAASAAPSVDVESARKLLDGAVTVIDLRPTGWYEESRISKPPRKSVNVPFAAGGDTAGFVAEVARAAPSAAARLIVMCGDGGADSAAAADALVAAGYSSVQVMEGGFAAYSAVWGPSGKRRPPAGRWVSTGKEALKSGLNVPGAAESYTEGGDLKSARWAQGFSDGEGLKL